MTNNLEHIRAQAKAVLARAQADSDLLAHLKSDPVAALQANGFDLADAEEFAQELGGAEVEGYRPRLCVISCHGSTAITCNISN